MRRLARVFRPSDGKSDAARRDGCACLFRRQGNPEALDAQDCQIRSWIATDQLGLKNGTIRRRHTNSLVTAQRMIRCHYDFRTPMKTARFESMPRI